MKIAIAFYSFSGNTKRMCLFLKRHLEAADNAVDLIEVKPLKETTSFLGQCRQAVMKRELELAGVETDLRNYDVTIFASPVWAFTFAPALRSYLNKIGSLENKKTACFLTCGSGAGSNKALGDLENILRIKGAHILFSKNLAGRKSNDKDFLEDNFKSLFEILK
ncbi:MAG: flavodoxin family protein [Candidatus Omnitrophota bacterium]|nr:MAG: flavodoxin family protein [Candidatus Omnitrophota bacterium]